MHQVSCTLLARGHARRPKSHGQAPSNSPTLPWPSIQRHAQFWPVAMGAGQKFMGGGQNFMGTAQNFMGTGHFSCPRPTLHWPGTQRRHAQFWPVAMGAGQKFMGAGQNFMGAGQNFMGAGQNFLGTPNIATVVPWPWARAKNSWARAKISWARAIFHAHAPTFPWPSTQLHALPYSRFANFA
jgi:hypothetical protein